MINSIERQIKLADKEVEVFLGYVNNILKKDLKEQPCDFLDDMDSPWGKDFGGITVMANEDLTEFEVGYETYDSGGYWEPPSSDYAEYSKHNTLHQAMWDVLKLSLQYDYNNWQESQWAEECVAEMEEGYL